MIELRKKECIDRFLSAVRFKFKGPTASQMLPSEQYMEKWYSEVATFKLSTLEKASEVTLESSLTAPTWYEFTSICRGIESNEPGSNHAPSSEESAAKAILDILQVNDMQYIDKIDLANALLLASQALFYSARKEALSHQEIIGEYNSLIARNIECIEFGHKEANAGEGLWVGYLDSLPKTQTE